MSQLPLPGVDGNGDGNVYIIAITDSCGPVSRGGVIATFNTDAEAKRAAGPLGVSAAVRVHDLQICCQRHGLELPEDVA